MLTAYRNPFLVEYTDIVRINGFRNPGYFLGINLKMVYSQKYFLDFFDVKNLRRLVKYLI